MRSKAETTLNFTLYWTPLTRNMEMVTSLLIPRLEHMC